MSQNGTRKTRPSVISSDATPIKRFHGFLKKKGRGKRWGVLNNEYLLLYMKEVSLTRDMPEPRSQYNVKQIKHIIQKGKSFELRFHDKSTRDFEADSPENAKAWVCAMQERMEWFRGLVDAADSQAKMLKSKELADLEEEVVQNKADVDKLKAEAQSKLEDLERMTRELKDKERDLKKRALVLERQAAQMQRQKEKARKSIFQWERQIEEKEDMMLERSDKLVRKKTAGKLGAAVAGMFSWKKKSTAVSAPVKVKTPAQLGDDEGEDVKEAENVDNGANEVSCPETGDSFTLSPVGLRFRVDCSDKSRAGKLSARRASAAVGKLRAMKRRARQTLIHQGAAAAKAVATLGPVFEGVAGTKTNATKLDSAGGGDRAEDPAATLRKSIAESICLATMENMARVSRHRLKSDSPTSRRTSPSFDKNTDGDGTADDEFSPPLNFDEISNLKMSDTVSCKDYAPTVFSALRLSYGVGDKSFIQSMGSLTGGKEGEGKSKMLFFMSKDKNYVMKTVKAHELEFFWTILKDYYWHMIANPDTLLCRFYGLYTIHYEDPKMRSTKKYHLVVMNNTFLTTWKIAHKFDLKGSINNRIVPPDQVHKVSVLKDLNLGQRHVWLPKGEYDDLTQQLKIDTWFLERNNIMDYSLLLGISEALKKPPERTEGKQFSRWQRVGGGIQCSRGACRGRADASSGSVYECYVLSIIDILQQFTWKKQAESVWKQQKYGSEVQISCVDAETYAARFREFMNNTVFQKYRWLRKSLQDHAAPGRPTMRKSSAVSAAAAGKPAKGL
eukprot:g2641.t1